uniref:Putative lipocalin n=1 Tax=Ixodes ricinus TaxID=34613 RepID=A0A6B0U4W5_IXORI
MIAALFLVIQLLGRSQSENCEGDFPNATEVMTSLERTYMFRSLEKSPEVQCSYQIFYIKTLRQKYDKVVLPRTGKINQSPLYVNRVEKSRIFLSSNP